jgi:hypothetical protein
MQFVHGGGNKCTEKNVYGVQGVEDVIGKLGRNVECSIQQHNDYAGHSSKKGKGRMYFQLSKN